MIRIKKINIKQFGNVKNFELELGNNSATIIYGNNESGKTTIMDAILKALFSDENINAHFEGLNKYATNINNIVSQTSQETRTLLHTSKDNLFDGTVEIEVDNLQMSFPQKEPLDRIISIPSDYARNMFVVREGELNIDHPDKWWNSIKGGLSESLDNYSEISDNIRNLSGIGAAGEWVNQAGRPIADKHKELHATLTELRAAKVDIKELNQLVKQRSGITAKLRTCEKNKEDQGNARKVLLYSEGQKLVNQYKDVQKETLTLGEFNEDKLRIWHNTEVEILKAKQIIELAVKHKDGYANLINKSLEDLEEWETQVASWEKLEKEYVPALEIKIASYKQKETKQQRGAGGAMSPVWMILCAIFSLSITYISVEINPVFSPVAGILFIALGVSVKMWWSSRNVGSQLEILARTIKSVFQQITNEEKSINEINEWLAENRNIYQDLKKKITTKDKEEMPEIEDITKEISLSINALESALQKLCNFTNALKISTGCSSREELQEKCNEKETRRISLDLLSDQINRLLGTRYEEEWEDVLYELKAVKNSGIEWNESVSGKLDKLIDTFNSQINALDENIEEKRVNIEKRGCKTEEDIWRQEDKIRAELSAFEADREAALIAIEIIKNVSREHDRLVNNIITERENSDSATNIFSVITGNRYKKVFLQKNNIYANTDDDKTILINHLSSGARAQLYFALRINLAQSLLKDKTAFMLLDDPFLSCDINRTKEMITILRKITKKGWQIIYFTISEEVIRIFEDRFND
ncbi:MAG: ATP-binding protein, partial [Candidatus Anammoxibacter sp.]